MAIISNQNSNITFNTAGGFAGSGVSTVTLTGAGSGYTIGGAGSSGQIYTTTGTNGSAWVTPNQNFVSNGGTTLMSVPHGQNEVVLEKAATLDVKGTVKINGLDLEERLKTIEKVLMIPERDVTMEAKYPSLKKKYDEYINLLGKYRTFEAIKGDEDGTT